MYNQRPDIAFVRRKLRQSKIISAIIYAGFLFLAQLLPPSWMWLFPLIVMAGVVIMLIITRTAYRKHVVSILSRDLDGVRYRDTVEAINWRSRWGSDRLSAAYYAGDYQTALNIGTYILRQPKAARALPAQLPILARIYFEQGDFENLTAICDCFDQATATHPQGKQLRNVFVIMRFYRLYLAGDFVGCQALYAPLLDDANQHKSNLDKVSTRFSYAIACFKAGDLGQAKQYFTYVIDTAPGLHYAGLAQTYLEAIACGATDIPHSNPVYPDEQYTLPNSRRIIWARRIAIAAWAILISLACILSLLSIRNQIRIKNAVAEYDDTFTVVEEIYPQYNGEAVNSWCVCLTEDDQIVVGDIFVYTGERTLNFEPIVTNVIVGKTYDQTEFGYQSSFTIVQHREDIPKDADDFTKLRINGKTYYFCILDVIPDIE